MDVPTPLHLQPYPEGMIVASPIDVLVDTARQVTQQLSIVQKLFQQNARFLDPSEKAWIDHILRSSSLLISELGHLTESGTEPVVGGRRRWLPDSAFFHQMKQLLRESPTGRDDLTLLLIAAQSLNSAIGLLSCCRDRWDWYQSTKTKEAHDQNMSDPSTDELSQLMNRRRRTRTLESNGLVRLSSLHLHRGRPSTSERESKDKMVETPADNWSSILSQNARGGLNDLDRSSRLSLAIVETVEKWRQNAEYALSRTSSLGLAEDFLIDRSDSSASVVEEDMGETSSTLQLVGDRTASLDNDPIPLNSETSPTMATRTRDSSQATRAEMHHPITNSYHQLPTTVVHQTSRRKPLSSQKYATHTLSTRTSASASTNTSAGSASTTNSTSTRSSTSPRFLRPASVSLRNSWEKESVIPDTDEQVDVPEPLRVRTSSVRPPIPEAPIVASSLSSSPPPPPVAPPPPPSRLSPQPQYLPYRREGSISSSISPWSSSSTLLPPYPHNSTGSIDNSSTQPNGYRISRGRAWLERQAANEV